MTLPAPYRVQDGCWNCRHVSLYQLVHKRGWHGYCEKSTDQDEIGAAGTCDHWEKRDE